MNHQFKLATIRGHSERLADDSVGGTSIAVELSKQRALLVNTLRAGAVHGLRIEVERLEGPLSSLLRQGTTTVAVGIAAGADTCDADADGVKASLSLGDLLKEVGADGLLPSE